MYTARARVKVDGKPGYKTHISESVFIQENKFDDRVAIFRATNMGGPAGYYLYDHIEDMQKDFELTDLSISERR